MIKKIYSLFAFILLANILFAQNNTIYFMNRLPQHMELNPAFQLNNKFYFSLPSVQAKVANTGFNLKEILVKGTGNQVDTTYISQAKLTESLHKTNFIWANAYVQLLGFGFKSEDNYWSFAINNKTDAFFQYPEKLLDIRKGNYDFATKQALPLDFSDISISAINYTEMALGYSRPFGTQLTLGAKAKFLKGAGSVKTNKTDILLTTQLDGNGQVESITADVDIDVRSSSVPYDISYDENGIIDSVSIDDKSLNDDYLDLFLFNGSWGMAFDFGATYQLTPKIMLAASALDLGWVRWSQNTKQITSKGSFTFQGLELVPDANGNINIDSIATVLSDSIIQSLSINDVDEAYASATIPKVLISGTYQLTDHVNVGAMLRADFYGKGARLSSTISSTLSFAKRWQLSASYSFMHHAYNNLGFGLSTNISAFNFYLITDYIPVRFEQEADFIVPLYMQTVSIRLGFNFLFGYKNKIDKPSIEIDDSFILK